MRLTMLIGLIVAGIGFVIFMVDFIYTIERGTKCEPERCPHCGEVIEVIDDVRQEFVWDDDCPICHGSGQGNGGYLGDSGECNCGYFIRFCLHCEGKL